jgi:hypothetical protein
LLALVSANRHDARATGRTHQSPSVQILFVKVPL